MPVETGGVTTVPDVTPPPLLSGTRYDIRELTSTLIALLVVSVTLLALWRSFDSAAQTEAQKALLSTGLSLLGTVMGYYFGRVPSERRAESAEATAQKVDEHATQVRQFARTAIDEALDVITESSTRGGGTDQVLAKLRTIRGRL